ncbi:hypothetical protein BC830DRAFT_909168 [Chytriomyces sp. MP71]|nr:hypothetical protein BC830DRAFT_909168 [Chytriomyces sp. MP71]
MPPKKTAAASSKVSPKKPAAKKLSPAGYKALITKSILALEERSGSTRAAIKKYITANLQENIEDAVFTQTIKKGVEEGIFISGSSHASVKLAKPRKSSPATKSAAKTKAASMENTKAEKESKPAVAVKKAVGRPKRETAVKKENKTPATKDEKKASSVKNGVKAPVAKKVRDSIRALKTGDYLTL